MYRTGAPALRNPRPPARATMAWSYGVILEHVRVLFEWASGAFRELFRASASTWCSWMKGMPKPRREEAARGDIATMRKEHRRSARAMASGQWRVPRRILRSGRSRRKTSARVSRDEGDALECLAVATQRHLILGTALEIFEGEGRQTAPREGTQLLDGDRLAQIVT